MTKLNKSRKFIATSATAALVASAIVPVASAAQINDFNSVAPFAQEAVQDLNDRGVIKGDQKGNFNPRNNVTRAEAATILTNALGLEGSGSTSFADVKTNAWYFDAIDAAVANGIFQGQGNNKFNPSGNLTRSEAAIILVDAFGLEGSADLSEFKDSASVKSWAQEALEIAVANEVMKGDAGNLKPNASISRQEFAVMYHRTEALEVAEEVSGTVKAINNTTVEVTLDEEVGNVKDLDFAIEGLEISNVAVKQTNKKVVVLTTSAQTADVDYAVTLNGEEIGSFKGLAAVIPTAIDVVQKSLQEVVGNQVTVQAKVTVADGQSKAGIPVTFNIINSYGDNSTGTLNPPIIAEALTNEEGIATYTYTRYGQTSQQIASSDEVQAYSTGKASVRSFAKVYWASIKPLAITEVTTGNSINNGAKKQYKIKAALYHTEGYTAAFTENGQVYPAGNYVNVAFKENIDVTPDKAVKTVDVIDGNGKNLGYPGQFTTSLGDQSQGIKVVKVPVDKNGEALITLTGSNAEVTPIVFVDNKENPANATGNRGRFNPTELFAEAPKLTIGKIQNLQLAVDSIGTEFAAAYYASLNSNTSTYTYVNAAGNVLIRDAVGNLTWIASASATLPTDAVVISERNPLRNGEVVPAGFVLTTANHVAGLPTFESDFTTGNSIHTYYNIPNGKSASSQLADALVNTGGRDYKAVLKDEKGNLAPTGTQVRVSVDVGSALRTGNGGSVYLVDKNSNSIHRLTTDASKSEKYVVNLATDSKGEVAFTLIGAKDAYATPTVFSETGDKAGLDKNDLQSVGGIAYFGDAVVKSATLTVDGKDAHTVSVGDLAAFTYQTVDQNNKYFNTYNQANLRVTFQFTSTFAGAEIYAASSVGADGKLVPGATPIAYVNQGSSNSAQALTVDAVNGKATVYVKATRGTTVTALASANTPALPQNLTASAVFNLSNNEGVQPGVPVTGKVIATDLENDRLLLLLNDGVTVRDVDYSGTNTRFYEGGSLVDISESTFEANPSVKLLGKEVTFTLAKDSTPTTVKNSGINSGITLKSGARIHLTNPNVVYDFHNQPVGTAADLIDMYVNADNITIKDATLFGNINVGGQGSGADYQDQKTVRKFTADNVTLNGDAYVHTNAKETFNLTNGSVFERVILEKAERVNILVGSKIKQLVVKASNADITGDNTGTVDYINLVGNVTAPSIATNAITNAPIVSAESSFTAATTTADTVTLTFTTSVAPADVIVTDVTGTTADVATVTAASATSLAVSFANVTAITTKKFEVTYKGLVYTVAYNTTSNAWTVTRK